MRPLCGPPFEMRTLEWDWEKGDQESGEVVEWQTSVVSVSELKDGSCVIPIYIECPSTYFCKEIQVLVVFIGKRFQNPNIPHHMYKIY